MAFVEGLLEINAGPSDVFFRNSCSVYKETQLASTVFHRLYDSVNEAEPNYPVPVRKTSLHNLCWSPKYQVGLIRAGKGSS